MYNFLEKDDSKLAIRNRQIEVVLFEESKRLSRLLLSPIDHKWHYVSDNALQAYSDNDQDDLVIESYRRELSRILKKFDVYSKSPTYLSKISWLANICGQGDSALTFLEGAFKLTESPVYAYKYAEQLLILDKKEKAVELLQSNLLSDYSPANKKLAELSVAESRYDLAEKYIDQSIENNPYDWSNHLIAGTLCLQKQDPKHAIRHFRIALKSKPNSSTLYTNYGIALYLQGQTKKTLKELRKAIHFNPLNKNALTVFSDLLLGENKNINEVEKYLTKYITLSGKSKTIIERLTSVYLKNKKYGSMIELLKKTKDYASSDSNYYNNYGVALSNKGESYNAIQYYLKAIELAGGIGKHYNDEGAELAVLNLSTALIEGKEFKEANNILKKCIESAPNDDCFNDPILYKTIMNYITSLFRLKRIDEAVLYAEKTIDLQNSHPLLVIDNCSLLSSFYVLNSGNEKTALSLALKAYDMARNIDFDDDYKSIMIVNNLVYMALENNDMVLAKEHINKLYNSMDEKICYVYATLGLYKIKTGNLEKGKELYDLAIANTHAREVKNILKQKQYLEIGRYWFDSDKKASRFNLKQAKKLKLCGVLYPAPILIQQTEDLLKKLEQ